MKLSLTERLIQKFGLWLARDKEPEHTYFCDFERIRYEVRPGDVLLIEGRNRVSNIIQQITQSPWSHAALYIGRIHDIDDPKLRIQMRQFYTGGADEQLVIESMLGKGTIITKLSHYEYDHIRICRPMGLTRKDGQKVTKYAISHLGIKYSIRHILDLARFMFPWSIFPRQWRSSLFAHNALKPTEEICTYMIADAFASVSFPILPKMIRKKGGFDLVRRNPKLFTPRDFDYSPFFSIIKYPILDISQSGNYHQLPWKEGEQSHDTDVFITDDQDQKQETE